MVIRSLADGNEIHEGSLQRALELARNGIGLTSPNPCVGAVIVDEDGHIVGQGSHTYEGVNHAEVIAIDQAGDRARGATLYVTLEPCAHQGRTGPCTQAVIAAGIGRVVAAMQDPNPLVAGKGFDQLRDAGIEVRVASGNLHDEARSLNESFAKYIRHHTPLVTLKSALTLDGKIAPPPATPLSREQVVLTGEVARAHVQQLRHQADAILVGVGTVIADNPLLTDRSGRRRHRPLLRVILDSKLRLPLDSRVVTTAQEDVLVLCSFAEEKKKRQLIKHGIRVEQIASATPEGHPYMQNVIRYLGELELTSLLIEGGARVNWAALESRIVDKIFFYYAPTILAGTNSVPLVAGAGFQKIASAPRVKSLKVHQFGEDFAIEGYLTDPYKD